MAILTLNSGSTSVKLAVFHVAQPDGTLIRFERENLSSPSGDPTQRLSAFAAKAGEDGITAVAHRVVHGGSHFSKPVRIDDEVEARIEALCELAPLHNPPALKWIRAARKLWGSEVPHIAVFDTAFYAQLPRVAAEYALPRSAGIDQSIRRYGFHGIAHEAMWRRWCELRPDLPRGGRLITLQLGGGCSITATRGGQAIDTSMGFSPLEGLMMATRSGDVDPAVVPYLARRLSCSSERVIELLNRESGLFGVSGSSSSISELLNDSSPQARFAIELYCYRARKYVGAYLAALGGCDGIVFGGGVGEHVPAIRKRILSDMHWAGIEIDPQTNEAACGAEACISAASSDVSVYAIPVDEEQVLAEAALSESRFAGWRAPA